MRFRTVQNACLTISGRGSLIFKFVPGIGRFWYMWLVACMSDLRAQATITCSLHLDGQSFEEHIELNRGGRLFREGSQTLVSTWRLVTYQSRAYDFLVVFLQDMLNIWERDPPRLYCMQLAEFPELNPWFCLCEWHLSTEHESLILQMVRIEVLTRSLTSSVRNLSNNAWAAEQRLASIWHAYHADSNWYAVLSKLVVLYNQRLSLLMCFLNWPGSFAKKFCLLSWRRKPVLIISSSNRDHWYCYGARKCLLKSFMERQFHATGQIDFWWVGDMEMSRGWYLPKRVLDGAASICKDE